MNGPPPRTYLGSVRSWGDRANIYRTSEALEVDLIDHYEVRRRRVFFDEVQLVTLHETRAAGPLPWVYYLLASALILPALIIGSDSPIFRNTLLAIGAALVLTALAMALSPVWVVTAFGKRTRAQIRFRWREAKARSVYADVCRAAGEAQRTLAGRMRPSLEEPPPPPSELPLSDSDALPLPPA